MRGAGRERPWLIVAGLLIGTAAPVSAQRVGLWEERDGVDGMPFSKPVRACRLGGVQTAALQAWPASCVVQPLQRTAAGMVSEARCAGGRSGVSVVLRRELVGDVNRNFQVTTSTQVVEAASKQTIHRSTIMLRYLGICPGSSNAPARSSATMLRAPLREPLAITLVRMLAPIFIVFGAATAAGLLFRKRWRDRLDQATVTNIVADAKGAATIPVLVTFTGLRGLPWWYAIATNNAKPLLVIEADGIRFRVVRQQRRLFSDIACLDVRQGPGTVNLDFAFHGSVFTFAANVGTMALAAHVIALLPADVPLSPRARAARTTA
jgi:hypothetical protein